MIYNECVPWNEFIHKLVYDIINTVYLYMLHAYPFCIRYFLHVLTSGVYEYWPETTE